MTMRCVQTETVSTSEGTDSYVNLNCLRLRCYGSEEWDATYSCKFVLKRFGVRNIVACSNPIPTTKHLRVSTIGCFHVTPLKLSAAFSGGILFCCKFSGDEMGWETFTEKMWVREDSKKKQLLMAEVPERGRRNVKKYTDRKTDNWRDGKETRSTEQEANEEDGNNITRGWKFLELKEGK
jgi:hypothetical protein